MSKIQSANLLPEETAGKRKDFWPTFFIVGAARCGTTSLWAHLRTHPDVFLPDMKEPGYFATSLRPVPRGDADRHCPDDLTTYRGIYNGSENFAAVGDASPSYLWDKDAPRRIRETCPGARIIIMLRDPIQRAFSHYLLKYREGGERRSFYNAVREDYARPAKGWWSSMLYVDLGLYAAQVQRYLDTFDREQIAICLFSDLHRDAADLFARIATHIGVDPALFATEELSRAENAFSAPKFPFLHRTAKRMFSRQLRHRILPARVNDWLSSSQIIYGKNRPQVDEESRRFLRDIFAPDLTQLEQALGRNLPELWKSCN